MQDIYWYFDHALFIVESLNCFHTAAVLQQIYNLNETNLDKQRWNCKQKSETVVCFPLKADVNCHEWQRESLS